VERERKPSGIRASEWINFVFQFLPMQESVNGNKRRRRRELFKRLPSGVKGTRAGG
jgi:hypothetical protein